MTDLPRLLYVGDVAVESSYHGSMLLHRLLQRYPADRLRIIESNLFPARTSRRLPGVMHQTLRVGGSRLLTTRLHAWYAKCLLATAAWRAAQVGRLAGGFGPEAILTVGHGYSWLTAARFAERSGVPLHLIVHDDWPRMVPSSLQVATEAAFARVYRQAASRLCASAYMIEEYQRRYGVPGTVLLPGRAYDAVDLPPVSPAERPARAEPVVAFAGTINSAGYAVLLRRLAESLSKRHGRLLLFGPMQPEQARHAGLDLSNIDLAGLIAADQLPHRLRREADALFVPMSFHTDESAGMRYGFPSKLADYTLVGLPLLICGPPTCSAVRWAQDNPGVAEVVTVDDAASIDAAVDRLVNDSTYRSALATAAQHAGARDFSAVATERIFQNALMQRAS